jgi:hypothetical protein
MLSKSVIYKTGTGHKGIKALIFRNCWVHSMIGLLQKVCQSNLGSLWIIFHL